MHVQRDGLFPQGGGTGVLAPVVVGGCANLDFVHMLVVDRGQHMHDTQDSDATVYLRMFDWDHLKGDAGSSAF